MDDIPREMVELVARNCDEPRWVRARLLTEAEYDWKRDRATVILRGAPFGWEPLTPMGKRGPRPTPTPILRARGSRRADRRPPRIQAPPGRPDPPSWLSAAARQVWDQLVPILEEMGVLTRADPLALGRYCRLHIRWLKEEDFLDHYGSSYPLKDGNGRVKCFMPFPQVATAAKLAALLVKMEQEFGLTPSARSRVEVDRRFVKGSREPTEFERMFLMPRPPTPADQMVPWSPGDEKIERQRREHREKMLDTQDNGDTG